MVTIRDRTNSVGELKTIDSIRQHILDGNAYRAWGTSFNLAVDTSMNFAFYGDGTHTNKVKFYVEADQSTNLRIIEDASWNAGGGPVNGAGVPVFRNASTLLHSCIMRPSPGSWSASQRMSSQ